VARGSQTARQAPRIALAWGVAPSIGAIEPHACQEEQEVARLSPAIRTHPETFRIRHAHGCAGREEAA